MLALLDMRKSREHTPWRADIGLALFLLIATAPSASAADVAALWRALASQGHVALLRHAIAPGGGDPPQFVIGDCAVQRNLSQEGRQQARRIGARFRKNGMEQRACFRASGAVVWKRPDCWGLVR